MSKLVLNFDKNNCQWCEDSKYNELLILHHIEYFQAAIQYDGVILMKEVLKYFGYNPKDFDIEILTRYWNDGSVDITYRKTGENEYKITFKTDN